MLISDQSPIVLIFLRNKFVIRIHISLEKKPILQSRMCFICKETTLYELFSEDSIFF